MQAVKLLTTSAQKAAVGMFSITRPHFGLPHRYIFSWGRPAAAVSAAGRPSVWHGGAHRWVHTQRPHLRAAAGNAGVELQSQVSQCCCSIVCALNWNAGSGPLTDIAFLVSESTSLKAADVLAPLQAWRGALGVSAAMTVREANCGPGGFSGSDGNGATMQCTVRGSMGASIDLDCGSMIDTGAWCILVHNQRQHASGLAYVMKVYCPLR